MATLIGTKGNTAKLEDFRVTLDSKENIIYLTSKDTDLLNQTAGGFRLRIAPGTPQDIALRAMLDNLATLNELVDADKEMHQRYEKRVIEDEEKTVTLVQGPDTAGVWTSYKEGHAPILRNQGILRGIDPSKEPVFYSPPSNIEQEKLLSITCKIIAQQVQKRKLTDFSGYQDHTFPLGILLDDTSNSLTWNFHRNPHLIIAGEPGSGKTTLIKVMDKYFSANNVFTMHVDPFVENASETEKTQRKLETIAATYVARTNEYEEGKRTFVPLVIFVDNVRFDEGEYRGSASNDTVVNYVKTCLALPSHLNIHFVVTAFNDENIKIDTKIVLGTPSLLTQQSIRSKHSDIEKWNTLKSKLRQQGTPVSYFLQYFFSSHGSHLSSVHQLVPFNTKDILDAN